MLINKSKSHLYWLLVEDCLCYIHKTPRTVAHNLIGNFKSLLPPDQPCADLYQQEPFWVACALIGTDVSWQEHLPLYLNMLTDYQRISSTINPGE